MTHKRPIRLLPTLFWLGVFIGIIGVIDTVVFLIWRWDKPPNNPGGPLASMGGWVVTWEQSGHDLMFLGGLICAFVAFRFRRKVNSEQRLP